MYTPCTGFDPSSSSYQKPALNTTQQAKEKTLFEIPSTTSQVCMRRQVPSPTEPALKREHGNEEK
jgi:hypothetical protein